MKCSGCCVAIRFPALVVSYIDSGRVAIVSLIRRAQAQTADRDSMRSSVTVMPLSDAETMQQVLGATSKVIVDQKGGQNLMYMPLDRLMQQAGAAQTPIETGRATPPQPETTQVPDTAPARREGLRSRDREAGR